MNNDTRNAAYISLVFTAIIWGLNAHVVSAAADELGVYTFLMLRFGVAFLGYRVLLLPNSSFRWAIVGTSKGPARFCVFGFLVAVALSVFYSFQTEAIKRDTVNSVFITTTCVLWVPFFSWSFALLKNEPRPRFSWDVAAGIGIVILGLVILELTPKKGAGAGINLSDGTVLALIGAAFLALEIVLITSFTKHEKDKTVLFLWTSYYTLVATLFFALLSFWYEDPIANVQGANLEVWGMVLFSGLIATAMANYVANWAQSLEVDGVQVITSTHRAILENLDAPCAAGFEVLINQLGAQRLYGCVLVLSGVLVAELHLAAGLFTGHLLDQRQPPGDGENNGEDQG